jgi:hypothetical protein
MMGRITDGFITPFCGDISERFFVDIPDKESEDRGIGSTVTSM